VKGLYAVAATTGAGLTSSVLGSGAATTSSSFVTSAGAAVGLASSATGASVAAASVAAGSSDLAFSSFAGLDFLKKPSTRAERRRPTLAAEGLAFYKQGRKRSTKERVAAAAGREFNEPPPSCPRQRARQ